MSDQSNEKNWLSQLQVMNTFRQRAIQKFDSLTAADEVAQKTPINLRYLIHTFQLTLTERLVMVLRTLYEQGKTDLEDFRWVLLDEVRADQKMGSQVGQLTLTRVIWLARLANTAGGGSRDSFTFRNQVQLDANGRIIGSKRSNLPTSHPFYQLTKAMETIYIPPVVNFPEFGGRVFFINQYGRFVCEAHRFSICKRCNVDYSGIGLFEGVDQSNVYAAMSGTDEDGRPLAVFERDANTAFAGMEATERLAAYPPAPMEDSFFALDYDANDPLAVPFCAWGNAIRYVPQWDQAVMGKDEAELAKITANGEVPAQLLPISNILTEACKDCQVTWQVTKYNFDLLMLHPSHHVSVDRLTGTKRTLIVHVDGVFVQTNTTAGAPARAAVGVFFGEGSRYNTATPFKRQIFSGVFADARNGHHPGVAMTPTTPIFAAVAVALQTVRNQLLPAREGLIEEAGQFNSGQAVRDAHRFKVILVTDSKEVVDSLTSIPAAYEATFLTGEVYLRAKEAAKAKKKAQKKRKKGPAAEGSSSSTQPVPGIEGHVDWDDFAPTEGDAKAVVISKQTGSVVANSDGILAVMRETMLLNTKGVSVEYYLQPSKVNKADALAKQGLGK